MKKNIATAILTLVTAFGFAKDSRVSDMATLESTPKLPYLKEKASPRRSFGYLKMGVKDNELEKKTDTLVIPGFGLGYRVHSDSSAIDFSASFNQRKAETTLGQEDIYYYTLPKINYLYYLNPKRNNSFYAGAGLAWGGVVSKDPLKNKTNFMGLIPNVALGYELNRSGLLRGFIQLDVSQPAIAAFDDGVLPKAYADVSVGAGF